MKKQYEAYICRSGLIPSVKYTTTVKIAREIFNEIKGKTKRRPYIRSAYFRGEKIFLDNFWPHLMQKRPAERMSRLKFFPCAVEMIQKSKTKPAEEKRKSKQVFYRFLGKVGSQFFMIQIKEDLKRGQKFLMSFFSYTKK